MDGNLVKKKVLLVGFGNSIHVARWVKQIASQDDWELHLFPVNFDAQIHEELKRLPIRVHALWPGRVMLGFLRHWPFQRGGKWAKRVSSTDSPRFLGWMLARLIRRLRPDLLHTLEFQHSAYLALTAREYLRGRWPPWAVSNWGSDIYLYGRLPDHQPRIRQILEGCNFYLCECHRDLGLARQMGLRGEPMEVLPVGGGFDLGRASELQEPGRTSQRRRVLVKGYQSWAGRSLVALRALALCADQLQGYQVGVYLASPEVELAVQVLAQSSGIAIATLPYVSYEETLRRFGSARLYLGLSISDAISQSLLEAMVMGAFPIQSNTSCAEEWVQDGSTALLVPPEDPEVVAESVRNALKDDRLVDQGAQANFAVAKERLEQARIRSGVVAMYRHMLGEQE
ncbi:MAG TPA: glycosyltransferase family 4 protein [Anaerolineales bacterium]|nr:glycosyltransferase family 4 protein [Anaerolineales bacterium]